MNKSLHIPASQDDLDEVKLKIEGGTNVDVNDAKGQTALMYAAETGRIDVVLYLLSQGADVNARSALYGLGPILNYAAAANRVEVIEILMARGANIDAVSFPGDNTALMYAAGTGHIEAVKLLLGKGADASLENSDDQTALDVARNRNQNDVVQLLESL
jgi:ankyrin repeat protein